MSLMARPRKPLLSRGLIVAAALALVDTEGLEAVSTRRLAAKLGVSGPSLYNHFRGKDEILDAVADRIVGQVDLSMFDGAADWRKALAEWARSYRGALADHPNIVPFLARGPGSRPAGLRMADAVFGALVEAGWPPAHATRIGTSMRCFVAGSALGSFARGFVDDATAHDAAEYPHPGRARLPADHRERVDEDAFETGLQALVDGLSLRYEQVAGRPAPPG